MKNKAVLSIAAGVAGLALSAVLYTSHTGPSGTNGNTGVVSRPTSNGEIQPPQKPEQLKPVERVVVTSK